MSSYSLYRNAWEVVGVTFDGSAYCPEHTPNDITRAGDMPAPVFASDDYAGMTCDECGEALQ
jgi:hypothetical protein